MPDGATPEPIQTTDLPIAPIEAKPQIGDGVFLTLVSALAAVEIGLLVWLLL